MIKSHKTSRYILKITLISILKLSISNSTPLTYNIYSNNKYKTNHKQNVFLIQKSENKFKFFIKNINIKSQILNQYLHWKGVRYRLGGYSKNGIDCSAFVQQIFKNQFSLKIPRSTWKQKKTGKNISKNSLRPGDLILFHINSIQQHIGIYLGNEYFIHASSSKGVIISTLKNNYWKKRFYKTKRILF